MDSWARPQREDPAGSQGGERWQGPPVSVPWVLFLLHRGREGVCAALTGRQMLFLPPVLSPHLGWPGSREPSVGKDGLGA